MHDLHVGDRVRVHPALAVLRDFSSSALYRISAMKVVEVPMVEIPPDQHCSWVRQMVQLESDERWFSDIWFYRPNPGEV